MACRVKRDVANGDKWERFLAAFEGAGPALNVNFARVSQGKTNLSLATSGLVMPNHLDQISNEIYGCNLSSWPADADAYDAWFRTKVQEALADQRPATPHAQVI